ncbi:MAG: dethiobiotin synthase [Verrucomicrobiota bacterium]|jgi:dethiobiotin synthetase
MGGFSRQSQAKRSTAQLTFVTANHTGVGKTLLSCLVLSYLRSKGVQAAALKPFCSGSRSDVRHLMRHMDRHLDRDTINPWYNPLPVAPGAWKDPRSRQEVIAHIDHIQARPDIQHLIIEGAGGLLSPLGNHYHLGDLISHYQPRVILVLTQQLGVINQTLVHTHWLSQLPCPIKPHLVFMQPRRTDPSFESNLEVISRWLPDYPTTCLPYLGPKAMDPNRIQEHTTKLAAKLSELFPI